MAFFPCVRFENQIILAMVGKNYGMKNWSKEQILENSIKLNSELHHMYKLISEMVLVCLKKGLQLVIENPYSSQHYLTRYWCIEPKLIDYDRTERGDYYVKPTQYWFINCEPKNNLIFEAQYLTPRKKIVYQKHSGDNSVRSLISPQYANRFIREFLIDERKEEQ